MGHPYSKIDYNNHMRKKHYLNILVIVLIVAVGLLLQQVFWQRPKKKVIAPEIPQESLLETKKETVIESVTGTVVDGTDVDAVALAILSIIQYTGPASATTAPTSAFASAPALPVLPVTRDESIPDDRDAIAEGDLTLLIVEDDPHYARVLLGLARDKGLKGIVALRGTQALTLARRFHPTAITLDIFLPDMLGWTVLNNLKLDPHTRHIPVQIISLEAERQHGLARGAFSYLVKPVTTQALEQCFDKIKAFATPHVKRLLVVEDNPVERDSVVELLGYQDLEITAVGSGAEAMTALLDRAFDCCVLDLRLPDMSGFELLAKVQAEPALRDVPIVVFTGKELSADEEIQLKTVAKSVVLKDVQSPERLFDETALFLHRVVADLPAAKQQLLGT